MAGKFWPRVRARYGRRLRSYTQPTSTEGTPRTSRPQPGRSYGRADTSTRRSSSSSETYTDAEAERLDVQERIPPTHPLGEKDPDQENPQQAPQGRPIYTIQVNRTKSTGHYFKITKRYRQSLGEVTEEEAYLEGFDSLEEFKQKWISIGGSWEPERVSSYTNSQSSRH